MTRRRVLLLGPVAVAAVMATTIWLTWPPPSAISPENAATLKEGMTLAEVEQILGGPARDERSGPIVTTDEPKDMPIYPRSAFASISFIAGPINSNPIVMRPVACFMHEANLDEGARWPTAFALWKWPRDRSAKQGRAGKPTSGRTSLLGAADSRPAVAN
jgi:hypothetical protein